MKTKPISIILFVFLFAIVAASILLFSLNHNSAQASFSESQATAPFITEFPMNNAAAPRYLIRAADDSFWFTAPGVNAIGRLVVTDTLDFDYTFYTIPTANSDPYQLVSDGSNIWFTQRAGNKIGKLEMATGLFTEYTIPTANSGPTGITRTPGGMIWFVQRDGNKLARLNPTTSLFTEYAYPNANALLEDVAVTPNGQGLWLSAPGANHVRHFDFADEVFDAAPVPTSDPLLGVLTPNQVAVDATNAIWMSTTNGHIGRYLATTISFFRWYRAAPPSANLGDLLVQTSGNGQITWFSDANTGYVGYIRTNNNGGVLSQWVYQLTARAPIGIQVDNYQAIWLADNQNHMIIKWDAPYTLNTYLPLIATP